MEEETANGAKKLVEERMRMAFSKIDAKGARAATAERGDKRTKANGREKKESFESSDGSESSPLKEEKD